MKKLIESRARCTLNYNEIRNQYQQKSGLISPDSTRNFSAFIKIKKN